MWAPMAGSRISGRRRLPRAAGDAAGGRSGPAVRVCRGLRLHSRAVADPRRDRGVAAQRASRAERHSGRRQPVRHRSLVAAAARGRTAAGRRAAGTAARSAARLPRRASLHEIGARSLRIRDLRNVAPLAPARARRDARRQPTAIAANNVVDGLLLVAQWQSNRTRRDSAALGRRRRRRQRPRRHALDALGDAIDGLSDALTAEAAYQMARGNTSRIAGTLSAIAQGEAPPPELEVALSRAAASRSPIACWCCSAARRSSIRAGRRPRTSARATAEPMLNAWASKLLGDAQQGALHRRAAQCDRRGGRDQEAAADASRRCSARRRLRRRAERRAPTQRTRLSSEIEQRVLYQAKRTSGGFDPTPKIRLQHARPADLAAGETTLFDVLEQARATAGCSPGRAAPTPRISTRRSAAIRARSTSPSSRPACRGREHTQRGAQKLQTLVAKPATATAEALSAAW